MNNKNTAEDFLTRLGGLLTHAKNNTVRVEDLINVFPELKESDDKRIRRELIFYLGDMPEDTELRNGVTNRDVLEWLEKQGEQKSTWTDNDRIMAFTLMRDVGQISFISKEGKDERIKWLNSLEDRFTGVNSECQGSKIS